jgi:hypothetical protein
LHKYALIARDVFISLMFWSMATGMACAQVGNLLSGAGGTVTPPAFSCNTPVFTCNSGFNSGTGACGVYFVCCGSSPFAVVGTFNGSTSSLSGSDLILVQGSASHVAISMNYQTLVNVQKFCATYTFVPNGYNMVFMLNNSNNGTFNGSQFSAGAGCEADFFQGFSQPAPPNNVFALLLDQQSGNNAGSNTFTYSSTQWYTPGVFASNAPNPPGQSPCNGNQGGTNFTYAGVNKVSTSPVPLNSPAGTGLTTTGDTYSVTITYDGNNLTETMYDITAGGTCTPVTSATCFTNTWTSVNIPAAVGANTAWVGLGSATNLAVTAAAQVNTFTYANP